MQMINKILLGTAAITLATAGSYPLGDMYFYTQDMHQQAALRLCEANSSSFVRFFASSRDQCYQETRGMRVSSTYSGVWSKPDRQHMALAQD